jgi:hypothetical protein
MLKSSGSYLCFSWEPPQFGRPESVVGHSLPVARRRAGREVRSGPKADLIPTPWLMLLASLTEEHDHAVSSERDPRAP